MKPMDNAGNMLIPLAIIAVLLSFLSIVRAQTSNQTPERQRTVAITANTSTQTFTENASAQISKKFEELNAQEAANLDAKRKALTNAGEKFTKAQSAQAAAQSVLLVRTQKVDAAQFRVKQLQASSPSAEQMATAIDALKTAESDRDAAQLAVTDSRATVEIAKYNVMMAEVEINKAYQELRVNHEIRDIQTWTLKVLNAQWRANPTESNLIALTDQITSISCAASIYANPLWKTTPNPGAFIFYQTVGERNRNETPHRITDLSNSNQKVCQGRYYVWSERIIKGQQKATSDKNATALDIGVDTTVVPVVESP
jgi:hypothetical protein